jgi:hypothetical protein
MDCLLTWKMNSISSDDYEYFSIILDANEGDYMRLLGQHQLAC